MQAKIIFIIYVILVILLITSTCFTNITSNVSPANELLDQYNYYKDVGKLQL